MIPCSKLPQGCAEAFAKAFANRITFIAMGALAFMLCACPPGERAPNTAFYGPSGMALAGRAFDKVYVANSGRDALQVIALAQDMRKIDLVAAPARYFPLDIPAGPHPQQVAASADGRFVFVLDQISATLRLIDADKTNLVAGEDGTPLTLGLGASNVEATALLGSLWACSPSDATDTSRCLARAYVGLRKNNTLVAVDVREDADGSGKLRLVVDSTLYTGAAIVSMAAHGHRATLFATDAQKPELLRITLPASSSLEGATITRTPLTLPGGALAVSGDGSVLAVARPASLDVALFYSDAHDIAAGTLLPLDANPVRTPLPQCISPCAQAALDACDGAHVADAALCSEPVGYGNGPNPYTALYLGSVPTAIIALDANSTGLPLTERCTSQSPEGITEFRQGFVVASLDGTIEYIGLSFDSRGAPQARLLDTSSCDTPRVKSSQQSLTVVDDILAPCAPLPQGRARMACLQDEEGDGIGRVGLMRGHSDARPIGLAWEGVLPGGDRSGGGGAIDESGRLFDGGLTEALDLGALPIRVRETDSLGQTTYLGDVLQVLTPQTAAGPCGEEGTSSSTLCELERRIVAIEQEGGRTYLVLDRPLRAACYNPGIQIAFRIRAGDAFLAGPLDELGNFAATPVRLNPGQTYGEGLQAGATGPLFFTIDPSLPTAAKEPACSRYLDDSPAAGSPPWRSRKNMTSFTVADPFTPMRSGQTLDALRNVMVNSGQMPFAMVMTKGATSGQAAAVNPPVLLVSFSGSDAVLIASPLQAPASVGSEPKERLLQ